MNYKLHGTVTLDNIYSLVLGNLVLKILHLKKIYNNAQHANIIKYS